MAWIQSESGISSLAPPLGIQIYGQLTCTEGDAIYCVGDFCNSELDFDKTKAQTGKFFATVTKDNSLRLIGESWKTHPEIFPKFQFSGAWHRPISRKLIQYIFEISIFRE